MDSRLAPRAPRNDGGGVFGSLMGDSVRCLGYRMSLLSKASPHTDERSARLAGIGWMLLSISMFSFGDALGKYIVATYSVGQLLWLRACAALLVLLPLMWRQRKAFTPLERPWLQLLRAVLSTLEVAAFFIATVYLPLADV